MKRMVDEKEFNKLKEDLSQAGNYIMKNGVKYYYYTFTTLHNNEKSEEVESTATGLFPIAPPSDEKIFESVEDFFEYIIQNLTDKSIISPSAKDFSIINNVIGSSAGPALIFLSLHGDTRNPNNNKITLNIKDSSITEFDLTLYYMGNSNSSLNVNTWS